MIELPLSVQIRNWLDERDAGSRVDPLTIERFISRAEGIERALHDASEACADRNEEIADLRFALSRALESNHEA